MSETTYQYLIKCKELYLKDIIPAVSVQLKDDSFILLRDLSDLIIKERGIDVFFSFISEGHYLVQLWTAHLILEQDNVSDKIHERCLLEIKKYANSPLAPLVALREKEWLSSYTKIV